MMSCGAIKCAHSYLYINDFVYIILYSRNTNVKFNRSILQYCDYILLLYTISRNPGRFVIILWKLFFGSYISIYVYNYIVRLCLSLNFSSAGSIWMIFCICVWVVSWMDSIYTSAGADCAADSTGQCQLSPIVII